VDAANEEAQATPEETLEASYLNLRRTLAQELIDPVKKCPPKFFEKLVVNLLVSMGYGGSRKDTNQAVGQSGDDGIDGIIKVDKLGLDVVYLQAKDGKRPSDDRLCRHLPAASKARGPGRAC
jgi:restriction system protein